MTTLADPPEIDTGPAMPRRPWRMSRPAIRQHSEMDCGAACLATISAYWGRKFSLNRMRDHARVGREGASLSNLRRAATELGFVAKARQVPTPELSKEPLPLIGNWKGYHWIVIYKVGKKHVTVADPASGLRKIPRDVFDKEFTGYCLTMVPTESFFQRKNDPSPLRGILHHFKPLRLNIFELFLASLAMQLVAVSMPLFSKFVIDEVVMQGEARWLWAAVIGVGGATFMQFFLSWMKTELSFLVALRANLSIAHAVYHRLLRLPMSYFSSRKAGDITSRLEEQETVTDFLTETATEILIDVTSAALFLAIMFWFNPYLATVAASFVVFHILIARVISPKLRLAFAESFEKEAEQESHLLETLRGIETIKSTGAAPFVRWRYDDLYATNANQGLKIEKISTTADVAVEAVSQIASITVLFIGASLVFQGEMSIGVLVAFTMFAGALFEPLEGLIGAWDDYQETLNAIERLNDILEREPEYAAPAAVPELIHIPSPRGAVSMSQIVFRYHPDDRNNVLQNFSLEIEPGEKVAFVGRSGCGKSTVLKMLYGMVAPTGGDLRIDGFDMRDLYLPSLRRHIGSVPQRATIFAGTVRDNIALGRPEATLNEVTEAMRLADAEAFINALPGGLDSKLAEGGANLSGGQRQRLAIARLFLQDPSIILLDEATSALDTASEKRIMVNIAERFAGRTVLMVAHRLSTVRNADRIVVMNRGLVAEQGTHAELMAQNGLYSRLHAGS